MTTAVISSGTFCGAVPRPLWIVTVRQQLLTVILLVLWNKTIRHGYYNRRSLSHLYPIHATTLMLLHIYTICVSVSKTVIT
jgi:hypothetical protein